jgi:hypothetical protein
MCEFTLVEQYLQISKDQVMGDDIIAERISANNDVVKQKRLGSKG